MNLKSVHRNIPRKSKKDTLLLPITRQMSDFQNSFNIGLSSKHVIKVTKDASLHYLLKCKYHQTIDNVKQISRLTINFNLIYYN